MTEELKPCPFCGSEANLRYERYVDDIIGNSVHCSDKFSVHCSNDKCIANDMFTEYSSSYDAISNWNRRAKND